MPLLDDVQTLRLLHHLINRIDRLEATVTAATDAAAAAIAKLVSTVDGIEAASHDMLIEATHLPEVVAAIESQTARLAGLLPAAMAPVEAVAAE